MGGSGAFAGLGFGGLSRVTLMRAMKRSQPSRIFTYDESQVGDSGIPDPNNRSEVIPSDLRTSSRKSSTTAESLGGVSGPLR